MQGFAKDIFERLTTAQVEFVVVGGVSAVLQGVPIVTLDLDRCYRRTPENNKKLAAALAPLPLRQRGVADAPGRPRTATADRIERRQLALPRYSPPRYSGERGWG